MRNCELILRRYRVVSDFTDRKEVLSKLIEPINWDWSTSINYRKEYVYDRIQEIKIVYAFLNEEERQRADLFIEEAQSVSRYLND